MRQNGSMTVKGCLSRSGMNGVNALRAAWWGLLFREDPIGFRARNAINAGSTANPEMVILTAPRCTIIAFIAPTSAVVQIRTVAHLQATVHPR
jgi:hypothetical protein